MNPTTFSCLLVEKGEGGQIRRSLTQRTLADLPPGEVLVRVQFSSLNYKDALAANAHPGVVRKLPHIPGIDAAGTVAESTDPRYQPGQPVVITGYELGAGQWGGWSEYVRVPAEWVVPLSGPTVPVGRGLPDSPQPKSMSGRDDRTTLISMSLQETMILGTAGFTAAQCVHAIQLNDVKPADGEIVVTGSTGGVGCLAVRLLAKLGYTVVAVTGKKELEPRLKEWGAARVASRSDVTSDSPKPMLGARWAGAVDTVGGDTLTTIIRQTKNYGVVAACGLVGGTDLPLTVHPFILRGITLAGIGSSALPYDRRLEIWRKLSGPWRLEGLESMATTIGLPQVEEYVQKILRGEIVGRTVVQLSGAGL